MIIATKAPDEIYAYSLDFSALLGAGNPIATIVSITAANQASIPRVGSTAEVIAAAPAPSIDGTGRR